MKLRTLLTATAATAALAGGAFAAAHETFKIGITQNNVGVDSYQTTYEKAFIEAAEDSDKGETTVLAAGGDLARQIARQLQGAKHFAAMVHGNASVAPLTLSPDPAFTITCEFQVHEPLPERLIDLPPPAVL